jgi:hypothetical protein
MSNLIIRKKEFDKGGKLNIAQLLASEKSRYEAKIANE